MLKLNLATVPRTVVFFGRVTGNCLEYKGGFLACAFDRDITETQAGGGITGERGTFQAIHTAFSGLAYIKDSRSHPLCQSEIQDLSQSPSQPR